jgi:Fur family peroxide stress response transcriptional regulator
LVSLTPSTANTQDLSFSLKKKGLRSTKQRLCVYDVILEKRDHPTADDIFLRVRKKLPKISFATVYNCLETFVECGLVKKINLDRNSSRYCPNLSPHAHFKCKDSDRIIDLPIDKETLNTLNNILPKGFSHAGFDLSFYGTSPSNN